MRFLLAAAMAFPGSASVPAAPNQPQQIEWSIGRDRSWPADQVMLTIESRWGRGDHSVWSNDYSLGELSGLSQQQLSGSRAPAGFAIVREAGRLDCSGWAGGFAGKGRCSFTADPTFSTYLEAHGIGRPDPRQSYTLTMSRVGRALVDSMAAIGYVHPTLDQLTAMGIHGVTADFVRGLAASGYRLQSADALVEFAIHGVDLAYIRELAAIGPQLAHLGADDLVSLRIHGITPAYVRAMAAIGPAFRSVSAQDLVSLGIHGARPELAQAYVRYGTGELRPDDVVSMAIHGVTPQFIDALASLGYRGFSADDLVSLSIHGVDAAYVRSLHDSGMERLSADQLVRLRLAGFQPGRP